MAGLAGHLAVAVEAAVMEGEVMAAAATVVAGAKVGVTAAEWTEG